MVHILIYFIRSFIIYSLSTFSVVTFRMVNVSKEFQSRNETETFTTLVSFVAFPGRASIPIRVFFAPE